MIAPRRRTPLAQAIITWGGGRLVSLLLLGASAWGLFHMYTDPRWRVQWVEVAGCRLVAPEQVVQASSLGNAWIVSLEPEQVSDRVEGLPGILEAAVSVGWPNRVRIAVDEDEPLATVRIADQEYWVSRTEGLVPPYGQAEGLPVLRVIGDELPPSAISGRVLAGLEAMRAAFPDHAEYLYDGIRGFQIQSERGYPVFLGDAADLDVKLQMLAALEEDLMAQGRTPALVDLSSVAGAYYQ